ncbi:MAG: amidohydrolase, partial [Oscillospiraceae bacterium]|nr:amidohydrolase [Oscillospiraceae bacterium]
MLLRNIAYIDENFLPQKGDVAVADGRIAAIGEHITGDYGEVIAGEGRLLLPGFINAHCHVPMTLLRGYGEGLPLQEWLNERIFPFEDRMTAEDTYWGALVGIAEMLASGVTSFSDMYSFCESVCEAAKLAGIKLNMSRGIVEFGDGGLYGSTRHAESERLIDAWNGACDGRIIAETAIHTEFTTNERVVREQAEYAKSRGVGVHVHLSETRREHVEGLQRRGVTVAKYFEDTGLFDSRVVAAHCTHVTEEDMKILQRHGVTAVHCPSSNLKLGSGIAPVPRMLELGVNVALGTDGASSNNNLNMLEELHLAALIHRGAAENPTLTPPEQMLRAATVSGAIAQGRADTGLIKVGYRADFAVLDTDKPHLTPTHDALSSVVFSAQASDVCMTVVDGRIVYKDGEVLLFNAREAMNKAAAAARRIA